MKGNCIGRIRLLFFDLENRTIMQNMIRMVQNMTILFVGLSE